MRGRRSRSRSEPARSAGTAARGRRPGADGDPSSSQEGVATGRFYNLLRPETVERWRTAAPPDFEFVLKAPQLITHEPSSPTYRRLRRPLSAAQQRRYGSFKPTPEVAKTWTQTLALARALRSKIVLFQCPASFEPTAANLRHLTAFFEKAERGGLAFAWEPRGHWPATEVERLCRRLDLIHCVDPFQRRSVWGEPAYFRLHGRGGHH